VDRLTFCLGAVLTVFSASVNAGQSATMAQQDQESEIKTFTGTIVKNGETFALNDTTNKMVYQLDDPQKASQFEGEKVNVKGTLDSTKQLIHVHAIEVAA
jgi:hypothetical protein